MADVLVIEDEDLTRRLLATRLEGAGHRVRAVANVAEAADVLAVAGVPDVLITDMFLPEGCGVDLVRALRADPASADLPVVFLTGPAGAADSAATPALGVAHLAKPFSAAALISAVDTAIAAGDRAVEGSVRARISGLGPSDDDERDLIADLLLVFVQRAPAARIAAEKAMDDGDAEALRSTALRLATGARNLGADALAEICEALRGRAVQGQLPVPVTVAASFRRTLAATCRVFTALAAELRPEPADGDLSSTAARSLRSAARFGSRR